MSSGMLFTLQYQLFTQHFEETNSIQPLRTQLAVQS